MCLNKKRCKSKKHKKNINVKNSKSELENMNYVNNFESPVSPDSIKEEDTDDSITGDGNNYICKECNREFLYKKNLKLHKKMHKAINIYKDHKNCFNDADQRNDFLLEVARLVQKITTDPNFDDVLLEANMVLKRDERSYTDLNYSDSKNYIPDLSGSHIPEVRDENLMQWAKQCVEKQPKVVLKRLHHDSNGEGSSMSTQIKQEYTPPPSNNYHQNWNEGFNYYPPSSERSISPELLESSINTSEVAKKRIRKHPCKDCGKVFTSIDNLKIHMRIHKGDKPYECKECGKRFRQRCHINNHMLIHQGIKPWKCKVCGEDFRQVANLLKHQQMKH